MNPASDESDGSLPEPAVRFEQERMETTDPGALLKRYKEEYPEFAVILDKLAEAAAMLQATPLWQVGPARVEQGDFPPPGRFGAYKVVRCIGRGGMGEVYEAIEEPLGRRVAIKTLRRQSISPTLLARFERERRTLARLHHTNVVPIYATGAEGNLLYFAMPFLAGASLGQVIKMARSHELSGKGLAGSSFEDLVHEAHSESQTSSEHQGDRDSSADESSREAVPAASAHHLSRSYIRTAVQVMATVAEGIHHAHQAGVIHRDLKPGNFVVETNGHSWVLDFGLAALRAETADPAPTGPMAYEISIPLTDPDTCLTDGSVGTPGYICREQLLDQRQLDRRSDVWGLGVTLYEVLTLRRAFADNRSALNGTPTRPRQLSPALDHALEAIILKALHPDPLHRYPTARELAEDLRRWLRREPVSVWPSHRAARPAWRLWLWSKRNKGWAAAIALALAGGLGLGIYAEEQRQQAVEREQAKERQLQLLDIQQMHQGYRRQGWSREIWERLASMTWKPEERGIVQAQAVASLSGLDVHTDKELRVYAPALAFAPGGRLWLGNTGEGAVRWDPETDRRETWAITVDGPLAIRPDGSPRQLGPTYTEPDRPGRFPIDPRPNPRFPLQVLDVERQAITRTLADPIEGGSRLLAWALAPQGSHAAAAVVDPQRRQRLLVWDADTGRLLHQFASRNAPESPALPGAGLAFSPDAELLASWDGSGRVDLWSLSEGRAVASFTGRNPAHCVAFGPNLWLRDEPRSAAGRWLLAVGDANGLITLWSPGAQGAWHILQGRGQGLGVLSLAFSPDGMLLATAGRIEGALWDVATGRRLVGFRADDYATALAFSPDGTHLACSFWSPFVQPKDRAHALVFRLEPSRGIRHLHGLPVGAIRAVYSRDGRRVAALSGDWWAGVWERDTGRLLRLLAVPRGQSADNAALAFSPDGRRLAVSGGDTATLWDLETGALQRWALPWALTEALAFVGHDHLILIRTEVRDGSRPPDSDAPATEYPRVCVLRDLLGHRPKDPVKEITEFAREVRDIEFAPDGSCFVIEGRAGPPGRSATRSVKVYDPEGRFLTDLPTEWPSDDPNVGIWFDPNGRVMALKTRPMGTLDLFEMPIGRFLGRVPEPVRGIAPGARLLVGTEYVDGSGFLHLYDREGGPLVARLGGGTGHLVDCLFSPDLDGRFLLWGDSSGLVCVGDLVEVRRRLARIGLGW